MLTTQMEGVDNIRKRVSAAEVFVAHVNAGLQDLRVSDDENYEKLLKGVHANHMRSMKNSDLIDTLQTELNKYKVVIEAEPEKIVLWHESDEFKN